MLLFSPWIRIFIVMVIHFNVIAIFQNIIVFLLQKQIIIL